MKPPTINNLIEITFKTTDDECWITAEEISIRVLRTDDGVVCDMYAGKLLPHDMDEAHLASCYAFFAEAAAWPQK